MWQCVRAFLVCIAVVPIVSGSQAAGTILLSEKIAGQLPIADLHLHPHPKISARGTRALMDRTGVRWAGGGARLGGSYVWQAYKSELGARFIAFAGQTELNAVYFSGGIAAMESADSAGIRALLSSAERDFKAGRIKGIGEIFINNSRSSRFPKFRRKGRTDAPSMRLLYKLVARYRGFLTLHMHADRDSVAGLERLLKSDRRGRILWNHCGVDASASVIRPLLRRHPNLFCELSFRYPPVVPSRLSYRSVFDRSGPSSSWLKLIEAYPDRFMIGTDAHSRSEYEGAIAMVRRGLLPYLRPATARMVAHGNAQRLFDLR